MAKFQLNPGETMIGSGMMSLYLKQGLTKKPFQGNIYITRYRALLRNVEAQEVFKKSEVKVWECRNCGHIVVGTAAPEVCPVCAHPQAYFEVHAENY